MKGGAHSLLVDADADNFHYAMLSSDGIMRDTVALSELKNAARVAVTLSGRA